MNSANMLHKAYGAPYADYISVAGGSPTGRTLSCTYDRQIFHVTTATDETAILDQPFKAGLFCGVVLEVDGGDLTLTVTGGYNADSATSITFADAGDFVMFVSIKVGTSYYWRVLKQEGTNVASSGDVTNTGAGATSYAEWDAAASQLGLFGASRTRGLNALSPRYELKWVAGANGLPQLNAVTDPSSGDTYNTNALIALLNADRDFEILGNNASSDDVTRSAEGGIQMQTDGGGTDSVILLPHLNTGQTAWSAVTWGSDQETEWECHIKTGAAITDQVIWAGLKLTNTGVMATDSDQAYFRYAPATNSGKWEAITSNGGTDTAADTSVTVALSTEYHLKIAIDSARLARFYINGSLVRTSAALVTEKDFIPYIGILESGAAAKALIVYGQSISRKVA